MASRNRTEGHRWERIIAQMLRNIGVYPNAVTCRSTNRSRDGQGIDFCNEDEARQGRMQDDIQAKTTVDTPNVEMLLRTMKDHDPLDERSVVIFWRKTGKSSGGKFMEKGRYAITYMDEYLNLLKKRELADLLQPFLNELLTTLESASPSEHAQLVKRLQELDIIHNSTKS
jgi:hypothetical protein